MVISVHKYDDIMYTRNLDEKKKQLISIGISAHTRSKDDIIIIIIIIIIT